MTMLRLNPSQRTALSETTRDLANLVFGALVLSQFIGDRGWSWWQVTLRSALWLALVSCALAIEREW